MTNIAAALAGFFTKPLWVAICAAMIGVLLWGIRRRRLAAVVTVGGAAILFLSTLSPVADFLLGPLERRYPPLAEAVDLRGFAFVAVLGSSYFQRPGVPITAQLDDEGMRRIVEGIRIAHSHGIPLLVSGAGSLGGAPPAIGYARLAHEFGFDGDFLLVSAAGRNTREEASAIAQLAAGRQFVLVTSASHMPRAMVIFGKGGVAPLPAPTAQRAFTRSIFSWNYWLPSALALRKSELALHEYFGLLEERLS